MTDMTRLLMKPEARSGVKKLNATDVDRELEGIALKLLVDEATDQDRVDYQKLLSWRRNDLLKLPRFTARKLGKI